MSRPNRARGLTRRRCLQIAAAAAGVGALQQSPARALMTARPIAWRGIALGAPASIELFMADRALARRSLDRAITELNRLENIFSLHRKNSTLVRLNASGEITDPPFDLVRLLSASNTISRESKGAFDPTVQPLWHLYAKHFAHRPYDRAGPSRADISAALELVDYRGVSATSQAVKFDRRGMALTLNGIAQGYITDRIVDLLRRDGFENFVADLGEPRAVGTHPTGRPWRAQIANDQVSKRAHSRIELVDQAIATSAPSGTKFEPDGKFHHLLDPRHGTCSRCHESVSVIAPTATIADGLSTAFAIMTKSEIERTANSFAHISVIMA